MNPKQLKLKFKSAHKAGTKAHLVETQLVCGGALNYRKKKRPFRRNKTVHLILRSRLLSGSRSLLMSNRQKWVQELIQKKARKYHSRLYKFSVNSNHLHILISFINESSQRDFLRDLAGTLALKVKRSFKISKNQRVWDARPFSRIIKPKAFLAISHYIDKNIHEASGFWDYEPRSISQLDRLISRINLRRLHSESS